MKGYTIILILVLVGCLLKLSPLRKLARWVVSAKYRAVLRRRKELLAERDRLQCKLNGINDEIRMIK
jgi:hypothetical protein